jgi:predicted transcriptional regulator of viral defense system
MTTKSTILSQKESELLENLIAKNGLFITFEQVVEKLSPLMSRQAIRNLVSKLVKNGWLVRIKKGTYYITTLESRGTFNVSNFIIAQIICSDSYISRESALQHYGMFDQHLKTIASVSLKRMSKKKIQGTTFEFIATSKDNFFGWDEVEIDSRAVKIAAVEKAILDILNFKRTVNSVDLVLEKLKDYQDSIDITKLNKFSKKQSVAARRILGFLFDKADIDSNYLYGLIKKESSSSRMTKDSKLFNAKWRLYYHNHFN